MTGLNLGDEQWYLISKPGKLIYDPWQGRKRVVSEEYFERKDMEQNPNIPVLSTGRGVERVVSRSEYDNRWRNKGYDIVEELTYMEAQEKAKELVELRKI